MRADPQRVFLAAGLASGALGVSVWLLYALLPGLAPSSSAHMGLMLQGFGFCFAWAVLSSLVPARLRAPPVPGWAHTVVLGGVLGTVIGLWLDAHRLAEAAFALAALVAFGAAASRVPRRDRPLDATASIGLLALLAAVLGATVRLGYVFDLIGTDAAQVGRRLLSEGMMMLLVLALSARAIPLMLRRRPRGERWPKVLAALALLLIVPLEHGLEWSGLRLLRVGLVVLMLLRDVPLSTWPDRGPAAFGVFIAHRMIALGWFVAAVAPGPASDAVHLVFIGGYSILLFAFSAARGALVPAMWAVVVSLALAMIARVGAPFTTEGYMTHLAYASGCWLVALLAWLVVRRRRAPAERGARPRAPRVHAARARGGVEMRLEVVDRLLEEHRLIEAMAERLDAMLDPFDLERVAEAIGFFEGYVERIHLAKELRVVEHMLSRRPNECREVARWVVAEQQALLRALAEARRAFERLEAGDPSGADHCRERLLAYRERLLDLLIDEDAWLYPLVDRLLAGQEGAASASLQRIEERAGGRAVVDRFERMAVPRRSSTLVVAPRKKPRKGPPASIDARTLAVGEGDSMDLVCTNLHDSAEHTVRRMSERGEGLAIEANQFLLVNGEEGIILDPGGPKVYPRLLVETRATLARRELRYVFLSHQDPDVVTSLNAWLVDTDADVYTSRLWHRFVPHFSVDRLLEGRLKPIPDGGMRLPLGGIELLILPAHFLHSCGNFQVYDPVSKTLFSGDLGASVDYARERATSLAELVPYMAGFHRRYMASRRAMAAWAKMARRLDIARMAPQHGAVLEGRAIVQDFIDWCEQLECGIDLLEDIFTIPE